MGGGTYLGVSVADLVVPVFTHAGLPPTPIHRARIVNIRLA